jgi:replicative DNA helicase
MTGGFQPGNLIIIAARPSMGKSRSVCNIAENAAIDHNAPVALFSLEMSETELAQRFVASQARIKGDDLRKGRVAEHKWPKIMEASQRLARRRCSSTTRPTSACSRSARRPAGCTSSTASG